MMECDRLKSIEEHEKKEREKQIQRLNGAKVCTINIYLYLHI